MKTNTEIQIAYFSMEIGTHQELKTYSGGLGILAGDTVKSAADLKLPFVGVTLLHKKGYLKQAINKDGIQEELPDAWNYQEYLKDTGKIIDVKIGSQKVFVKAWTKKIPGATGGEVNIYYLDTDLPENDQKHRHLTDHLYGGDEDYRLQQEIILGIGGLKMLRSLGYDNLQKYHMNEGHAVLLILELIEEYQKELGVDTVTEEILTRIKKEAVFTTHTPVEAGHDRFPLNKMIEALGERYVFFNGYTFCQDGVCNLTHLGLEFCEFVNGVAKKHREVSQEMFPNHFIDSITNGVHLNTWAAPSFHKLFDKHPPEWRSDNSGLRYAMSIPLTQIWDAHYEAKTNMINFIKDRTGEQLDKDIFTIGFARRVTAYKRANFLFNDIEKLKDIYKKSGPFQIIYAGKAHPKDHEGKKIIQEIISAKDKLSPEIKFIFVPDYDMKLASYLISGVDVWLNNPKPPLEASGTSGMKAALNGIPSFSVLDGWWLEGWIENVTGWSIGTANDGIRAYNEEQEINDLYNKLENLIIPMFYKDRNKYCSIMRYCISLNASFFNTERMVKEYIYKAYFM